MMIINYFLSILYGIHFILLLGIFHPLQWIAFTIFGRKAHRKVVEILNFGILYGQLFMGNRISYQEKESIPTGRPIIFIANHQSLYDIIGIIWFLRKYNPIFVAKKSLSQGIPSISINLRYSRAALIDRSNRKQALMEISRLGSLIQSENKSAVIFPEGTRSRKGLKRFSSSGVEILLKKAPEAIVVPVVINGTGHVDAFKIYPIRSFEKISWTTLTPIDPSGKDAKEVVEQARSQIAQALE